MPTNPTTPETRSARMIALIQQSGLTHAQIAAELEVSKKSVDNWAIGRRNPPALAVRAMERLIKEGNNP